MKELKLIFILFVAKAFSNPDNRLHVQDGGKFVVNHKNYKTVDYRIENLEFVTSTKNSIGYPSYRRVPRQITYQIHKLAKYS